MRGSKGRHEGHLKFVLAIGLAIIVFGILLIAVGLPAYRAQRFMLGFRRLQVGQSSFEDVKRFALQNGGIAVPIRDPPAECAVAYCQFSFIFYNTWLQRLKLAPDMRFIAFMTIENNKLTAAEINMVCNGPTRFEQVFVRERQESHTGEAYKLVSYFGAPRLGIEMTRDAAQDKREAAFQVKVSCLAKIGGCPEPHDRIPAIPVNTGNSLERER